MQINSNNIATITRHTRSNVKDKGTKRLIRFILFDLCLYLYDHQNQIQVKSTNEK
jgi:hypothetical protein